MGLRILSLLPDQEHFLALHCSGTTVLHWLQEEFHRVWISSINWKQELICRGIFALHICHNSWERAPSFCDLRSKHNLLLFSKGLWEQEPYVTWYRSTFFRKKASQIFTSRTKSTKFWFCCLHGDEFSSFSVSSLIASVSTVFWGVLAEVVFTSRWCVLLRRTLLLGLYVTFAHLSDRLHSPTKQNTL